MLLKVTTYRIIRLIDYFNMITKTHASFDKHMSISIISYQTTSSMQSMFYQSNTMTSMTKSPINNNDIRISQKRPDFLCHNGSMNDRFIHTNNRNKKKMPLYYTKEHPRVKTFLSQSFDKSLWIFFIQLINKNFKMFIFIDIRQLEEKRDSK